jgi:hypothetical protein
MAIRIEHVGEVADRGPARAGQPVVRLILVSFALVGDLFKEQL